MLYATHAFLGIIVSPYIEGTFNIQPMDLNGFVQLATGVLIGTGLPDIDDPPSSIGRMFPKISKKVNSRFGHRRFVHSYYFHAAVLGILSLLATIIYYLPFTRIPINIFPFVMTTVLTALSHSYLDTMNTEGVPLFNNKTINTWYDDRGKLISVGSREEMELQVIFLFVAMCVILFHIIPPAQLAYYINNRPYNAIEIIKSKNATYEAVIDAQGYWKGTSAPLAKTTVSMRVFYVDEKNESVAVTLNGSRELIFADLNGKDPKALITLTRVLDMHFYYAPLKQKRISLLEKNLAKKDLPKRSLITGKIVTTASEDVERSLLGELSSSNEMGSSLVKSHSEKQGVYSLNLFPGYRLIPILPLSVESADLLIFYRIYPKREKGM